MNFGDRELVMVPDITFAGAHAALAKAAEADRALEQPTEPVDTLTIDTSDELDEIEDPASLWIAEAQIVDPFCEALVDADERLRDAEARASELLHDARKQADTLLLEAEAFARQRRAEAERWSRSHVSEADQVGTQRLLEAETRAREIIDQAHVDATKRRAEPLPEALREPVAARTETDASADATHRRRRFSTPVKVAAVVVLLAVVIFGSTVIRSYIAEPFVVESRSMEPELHEGDRVLVDKVAYRVGDAKRGDIVVLDASRIEGAPPELGKTLVKRVVGLPGETVQVANNRLMIDGSPIDEPWLGDVESPSFGPVVVPANSLVVLGDSRVISVDSRTFGPVPIDAVIGRVEAIIWPPEDVGRV